MARQGEAGQGGAWQGIDFSLTINRRADYGKQ